MGDPPASTLDGKRPAATDASSGRPWPMRRLAGVDRRTEWPASIDAPGGLLARCLSGGATRGRPGAPHNRTSTQVAFPTRCLPADATRGRPGAPTTARVPSGSEPQALTGERRGLSRVMPRVILARHGSTPAQMHALRGVADSCRSRRISAASVRHDRGMAQSAPRYNARLLRAIRRLDDESVPIAEVCRRVGARAERLGVPRPSYVHVRRIVLSERERARELREIRNEALAGVVTRMLPNPVDLSLRRQEVLARDRFRRGRPTPKL